MSKKSIVGKESFQRINFLYQASECMLNVSNEISMHYNDLITGIAKKSVLRLDQPLKRTICKGCHVLLEPGTTSTIRVKKKICRVRCSKCGTVKRFQIGKPYKTWSQKQDSTVEVIDYGKR